MRDKLSAHRQDKPRPLSDFRDDVPAELAHVIECMMDKDPERRYQTPAEVEEVLRPFSDPQPRRSRRIWYAAAAVLLLFGAVAAAIATILVRTDQGEFVLETNDPDIAVQLDKAGVQIHDHSGKRVYLLKVGKQRMDAGAYDIDVSELPAGIEMSSPTFRLKRGETVRLTARVRSSPAEAAEPAASVLKSFGPKDKPITRDGVTTDQGGWRIEAKEKRTIRLFEIANPKVEECQVIYQAKLKTENVQGKAYLEMWCRFPGQGEFFSKGIMNPVSGTTDWTSHQTPFFLKKGERPDLIKLNVVIEGSGTVWIKDITLRKAGLF